MQSNHLKATFYVSNNRYTFRTNDGVLTGHCHAPNPARFRRALDAQYALLIEQGYSPEIINSPIEG
ncbi:hypothetical protein [Pseudanabaena sp. BC1403]|uniref:hypothetical protein n=1 Tax=Pseudanabaena sp. BC1403 TaxID=2043171 RepID=UPI0011AF68E3|nr:hypothetical protein [Pseudanabaena sp. BC1403]